MYLFGRPGEQSKDTEFIVKNYGDSSINVIFDITGDLNCVFRENEVIVNGNSDYTNSIICTFGPEKQNGRITMVTPLCDRSLEVTLDPTVGGRILSLLFGSGLISLLIWVLIAGFVATFMIILGLVKKR